MSEPLELEYFNWLCAKVVRLRKTVPSESYWTLLETLHNTEFVWTLLGDDNRSEDGKELRAEFLIEADIPDNIEWRTIPGCSMLEMLIAFSRRAEFMNGEKAKKWFWEFIENLGLKNYNDATGITPDDIQETLEPMIWRTFEMDGRGGMFPMIHPHRDQRNVEIWYQFCDYLVDHDRLL